MNYSIIIFLVLLSLFLLWKKKNLRIQKLIFPLFYVILYPTQVGLGLMRKIGTKYREIVKFFGYCFIGIAFLGMIYAIVNLIFSFYIVILEPQPVVKLILPGSTIPGVGKITFSYWLISIFVLAFVHEFAHGVVAIAHKIKLKSSGFGFFSIFIPIIPLFFVEPDEKVMKKKQDVSQYSVFAAGPVINIVFYFLFILIISLIMNPVLSAVAEPSGISVQAINESYPAYEHFQEKTFINKVDNVTITNAQEFVDAIEDIKPNQTILISNDNQIFNITTVSSPDEPEKGFIGVSNFSNEFSFFNKTFGKVFIWTYNLFMFIAVLNLLVGLINLLPLGPIDGGRMLYVFLLRITGSEEKAKKWWLRASVATILVLVILFVLPFILKWIF
jgi:membrane-associated protease RseP (regulator of RpoE activity)